MSLEQAQAWAILFGSFGTMVVAIVVAWRQNGTVKKVTEIHDQVGTSANGRTLGEVIEANDLTPHT